MNKKIKDFLKSINKGKLYKAQQVIADKLGVHKTSISKWCLGKYQPSEENIKKMAKIFKKSQEEIHEIFAINSNTNEEFEHLKKDNKLKDKEITILKHEINVLKKENELLKEKLKNKKN